MEEAGKSRSLVPCWVRNLLRGTSPTREQRPNRQTTALDLQCISRSLQVQTSVRKAVRTSATTNHPTSVLELAEIVQAEYQQEGKVPDWILRLAFHSLSLDPMPPPPTVAECLKIIAVDLGCGTLNDGILDER